MYMPTPDFNSTHFLPVPDHQPQVAFLLVPHSVKQQQNHIFKHKYVYTLKEIPYEKLFTICNEL